MIRERPPPVSDHHQPLWLDRCVVREHRLQHGCLGWWLSHPDYCGGVMWKNLTDKVHGTLELITSAAFRQSVRPGAFRSEFVLDGANGRVSVPNAQFSPTAALTVACWAYSSPTGVRGMLNNRQNAAGRQGWVLEHNAGSVNLYVHVGGAYQGSPTLTMTATAWNHVCGTFNGSTVRIYKDGVEVGTGTAASGSIAYDSATSLYLGAEYISDGNRVWDGAIDDFRIYDRALSAAEVFDLYLESRRGYPNVLAGRRRRNPITDALGGIARRPRMTNPAPLEPAFEYVW